jgi:hypothetical protein
MGMVMRRSFFRNSHPFHQQPWATGHCGHPLAGGALTLAGRVGLAGPVSRTDSDLTYNGMDPSDPRTWVRPYNPQPGMCALFNFDPFVGGNQSQYRTGAGLVDSGRPQTMAVDRAPRRKRWGRR